MTRVDDVTTSHEDVGRVPRRRGAVNGFLVVLLGLWGAAVPLFGPYLGLSYGTDNPWVFSASWLLLSLLPGLAVVLGGLGLIGTARSAGGVFSGWLAAVGGAWFVLGRPISALWNGGQPAGGEPLATSAAGRLVIELLVFSGIGVLIVFLSAVALGRFTAGTGRTVVTGVPEQDRRDHDDLDGRHRLDDRTDDTRTADNRTADGRTDTRTADGRTDMLPTGATRDDAYAKGAQDEAHRRDLPAYPVRDDRTDTPAEQTQAMRRTPTDRR